MRTYNKKYHVADILGPIMIGPSSSHTAGACRLGLLARTIYGDTPTRVVCAMHGSFAHTYRGHGSDRALAGGLLGFQPDDARLIDALDLAKENGLDVSFEPIDLGAVHPNTVKIIFEGNDDPFYIIGSSVGGGAVEITNINGTEVRFTGEYPTLIFRYVDRIGMINTITNLVMVAGVSIASLNVTREDNIATMVLELDDPVVDFLIERCNSMQELLFFKCIQ